MSRRVRKSHLLVREEMGDHSGDQLVGHLATVLQGGACESLQGWP